MSKYFNFLMVVVAIVVLGISANAQAGLLFSDSFDTDPSSSNVNFQIDDRTGGTYGGTGSITYNSYVTGTGNSLSVGFTDGSKEVMQLDISSSESDSYGFVWLDHDFGSTDSAGGLDIAYSAKLINLGGQFQAIAIGHTTAAITDSDDRPLSHGLVFFIRGTGAASAREYGTSTTAFDWLDGDPNDEEYHDFLFEVRGSTGDNPFDGSDKVNVKMYVDGDEVIDYTTAGVWGSNNYIGLETCDTATSYFDDLSITQIPEPGTFALLTTGLIGLLCYAWRKRK